MKKLLLFLSVFLLVFTAVKAQPGYINTIAGGSSGNNTLAVNAQLLYPFDVAKDGAGNIYLSQVGNSIIQKIDATTGIISIIAGNGRTGYSGDGGQATNAELYYPRGIAVDLQGNVYIADEINSRIRKVDANTGVISTVAGGGTGGLGDGGKAISAGLNGPWGVAVDKLGNIYISDTYDFRVRKIDHSTGVINTIAGDGTVTYSNDAYGQPATDAEIGYSVGIKVDTTGNVYFSDQGTNTVSQIDINGNLNTFVGNGNFGYCGDNGPAIDACLAYPSGLAIDDTGNIYISDILNSRIRKVDHFTQYITTVAGNGNFGFSSDGGPADTTSLNQPTGEAVGNHGDLYIADFENNRLRMVDSLGIMHTAAGGTGVGDGGSALNAALSYPMNVSVDNSSNIYIADYFDNRVRKITTSTGLISTVAGSGFPRYGSDNGLADTSSLFYPSGVVADDSGNVYILCSGDARVRKVNGVTGIITTIGGNGSQGYTNDNVPATDAEFYFAPPSIVQIGIYYYYYYFNYGLTLDNGGNIFIADGNNRIRRIDAKTNIITTVVGTGYPGVNGDGGPATDAQLDNPTNVAFDDSGNLYVADFGNFRIREVEKSTGIINTVAGGGVDVGQGELATDALLYPSAMAIDSFGDIYLADVFNNQIREVNSSTGILTTIAGNGIFAYGGDGGKGTNAEMEYPAGVTLDANNNVYIADTYNNRVRKLNALPRVSGINLASAIGDINVYPNPTNSTVNINFGSNTVSGNATILVSDITGRQVIAMTKYVTKGANVSLDMSSLSAGMYFVSFNIGDNHEVTKIVKD